ncbi:LacI family DNA-binding transcriptional regulator [Microbacterium sp. ASV49]|uniref:LacI family DNA-binding transcriptional regulator n=1 Tax=Microbacterium candidum TaxID=3041922 RepID=A0ABT7N493_9MICO|nr:LacI family DNA-binding transcriptional regulator [Microbacterium sp. ASV49]MDL9981520.1 LacI family DNA-binding transcriptional regulator [Microbacterium sp. ASV49]
MADITDVARAAGVSTATVSRALAGRPHVSAATRERILRLAAELGYVPSSSASGLRSGHTRAVAVVVPRIDGWFYSSVVEGADAELRRAGYDLVLFSLGGRDGERERLFHESILGKRGDGVLALCIDFSRGERAQLAELRLPTMIVGGPVRGVRYVGIDENEAAAIATEHLLELGHTDILFIEGGAEIGQRLNPRVSKERRQGYENAMRAAGRPEEAIRSIQGEFSAAVARARMHELLEAGSVPTGIVAASDEMAVGAILALRARGLRVPEDVSVVGVDGHPVAELFSLTTVAQDPFTQGRTAARMLLDDIGARSSRRSVRVPVEFVPRTSTAPPRDSRSSATEDRSSSSMTA